MIPYFSNSESDHLDISRNGCSTSGEVLNLGHFDNQSIPTTSVLGNDGYKDSLDSPEAVLWRRGPLLGKGAFGSVWLALQENVSIINTNTINN